MRSLTRVLRLAGVLSASPCSASLSASSRHPSKSTNSMAARISTSSSAAAALSRARLIRSRPGFVPAITTTSTRRPATTTRATGRQQRAFAVASTAIARRQRLRNGASSSTSAAALERWFVPGTPSARSPRRLFSTAPAEVSTAGNRGEEEEVVDGAAPFKVNLLEMDNEEVEQFLVGLGEPKYRAQQVLKWMYEGGAGSFEDMSNLPKALRAKLTTVATVGVLEVAAKQTSKDGTKKLAYRLSDGQLIESVLMPYSDGRRTACISSQAGCAMGCVFCATGQMGFKRQLSSAEIFEQAYRFSQELAAKGDRLSNVVFMGMGEPLANYKNVMEAVRRINTELGIGARHITISTVGLVPRIMRLSQEDIQVKLAVSLHAANDRERSALLPVNRRFPLSELMDACREYVDVSGRRMTFEWALIRGENDTAEVASELGRLLRPLKGMCHVNIIPLNPTEGYKGGPSVADAVNQFVEVLARHGVPATPRTRRGIDIDAGCGQLTVKVEKYDVLGKGL